MTYTKETWISTKALAAADLIHMETQVTEGLSSLTTHDATGHTSTYYTKTLMDSYFWSQYNDGDSSTLNADTLSGQHASAIASGIQSGFMAWWDHRNGAIPSGWKFCDGTSSTLDMRGRFPVGSGTLGVGATGGNSTITPKGSVVVGYCTLTGDQVNHRHSFVQEDQGGSNGGTPYGGIYTITAYNESFEGVTSITSTVGGNTPHNHPGTFAGDEVDMLPLYNTLVVMQKS